MWSDALANEIKVVRNLITPFSGVSNFAITSHIIMINDATIF